MPGQINQFGDLAVVRSSSDGEGWIINAGYRSGLFGHDNAFFWQWLKDGTLRLGDAAARNFSFSRKIELGEPENVGVFAGEDCLWIDPVTPGQSDQALLTMLYCSTDCRCRAGAPVQNLSHSASFH